MAKSGQTLVHVLSLCSVSSKQDYIFGPSAAGITGEVIATNRIANRGMSPLNMSSSFPNEFRYILLHPIRAKKKFRRYDEPFYC